MHCICCLKLEHDHPKFLEALDGVAYLPTYLAHVRLGMTTLLAQIGHKLAGLLAALLCSASLERCANGETRHWIVGIAGLRPALTLDMARSLRNER